jgi:GT2 family glycosyltransferase
MKKPLVSIIIPVKEINDYLRQETLPALWQQEDQDFEVIILPDKKTKEVFRKTLVIPSWPKTGPADKRDLGAKMAKGEILAFLDDDSYPTADWLRKASVLFKSGVAGVCGPNLTPAHNTWRQKVSGYVWSSWLGSGGAGTYRCRAEKRRLVDDFPSVNLLVKKEDFVKVGGFNSHFWPGEDTELCYALVYKLGKKIVYDPKVIVYHHRREVFGPHLKQISRYALHRGHFARILPKTSWRWGYWLPSLFLLWLVFGWLLTLIGGKWLYLGPILIYKVLLLFTIIKVYQQEKRVRIAVMTGPAIFFTHLVYGFFFLKGLLARNLKQ